MTETLSWLAIESGSWYGDDGHMIQTGRVMANGGDTEAMSYAGGNTQGGGWCGSYATTSSSWCAPLPFCSPGSFTRFSVCRESERRSIATRLVLYRVRFRDALQLNSCTVRCLLTSSFFLTPSLF